MNLGLLLNVMLRPSLLRLSLVVLLLVLGLLGLVTGQAGDGGTNSTSGAVCQARRQVAELALGLLLLTSQVLLATGLLQALDPSMNVSAPQRRNKEMMHTSWPNRPPTVSFAEPSVWFHEPAARSG